MRSRVLKARDVVFNDPFGVGLGVSPTAQQHREEVESAYAAGLRDGQEGALSALPKLLASLNDAVAELKTAWAQQQRADRQAIIDAASELAQWMVGRELTNDPSLAVAQIDDAVASVISDEPVTVYVAPELVDVIEAEWHPTRAASVVGDPTLLRGELRVAAGVSNADLRWAVALERAREALDLVADASLDAGASE
jgi:flagellar biosynthesis/type III secretory pathway protein FliH